MVVQRWTNFLTSLQPSPRFQEEEARLGPSHLVPRLGNFMTSLSFCLAWFLFRLLRREYLEMRKGMEGETFLFIKQILPGKIHSGAFLCVFEFELVYLSHFLEISKGRK